MKGITVFNPFRKDASGFTKKDDKIAMKYIDLYLAGIPSQDFTAADAFLTGHGWTVEHAHAVMDHFHPEPQNQEPRVYSEQEVASARAALVLHQAGEEKSADELLAKHGLTASDVPACVDQYYAQFDLTDDEPIPHGSQATS
jgi:hypothetical protein